MLTITAISELITLVD